MIVVIDYGMGNLRSVSKALENVDAKVNPALSTRKRHYKLRKGGVKISSKPRDIKKADKLVLPGVGAFGDAVKHLKSQGLFSPIIKAIKAKKPFLGICLGMQLLFEYSDENPGIKGLGILKGKVKSFPINVKIPQIGWNQIIKTKRPLPAPRLRQAGLPAGRQERPKTKVRCSLLKGIPDNIYMYFCHSYFVVPEDKKVIATQTRYGKNFTSMVCNGNVFGVQFHPEKSQRWGLRILRNFVEL